VRKVIFMPLRSKTAVTTALALSLSLGLGACAVPQDANRSLYSVKQPVVERNNFTLDLASNADGLPLPEQSRLAEWFEAMDLGYGDRVAIDSAMASEAVGSDVAAIAGRYGILLSDGAPVTPGFVEPGRVRVVVTRSRAHVPGCPEWTDQFASNLNNVTAPGYGCAVNSNLAAMIADPEHLLKGEEGTGETYVSRSTTAIEALRDATPTGTAALSAVSTQ
jgi:pilus assembly protein CpaD